MCVCYNVIVEWSDYITEKYLAWRRDKPGRAGSASVYARDVLDITPQLLNEWMNRGKTPRNEKSITKLVDVFGTEIYEVLGLPIPDLLAELPKEWAERFFAARREYTEELSKRDMLTDSPEARHIIAEAFVRHGINFTFTDGDDDKGPS